MATVMFRSVTQFSTIFERKTSQHSGLTSLKSLKEYQKCTIRSRCAYDSNWLPTNSHRVDISFRSAWISILSYSKLGTTFLLSLFHVCLAWRRTLLLLFRAEWQSGRPSNRKRFVSVEMSTVIKTVKARTTKRTSTANNHPVFHHIGLLPFQPLSLWNRRSKGGKAYDKVTYNIPCSFSCRSENNYSKNNNIINDCNGNHCCHITTIRFSFFQPLLRREGISNTRSNAWTKKVIRVNAIEKFINSLNLLTHTDKRAPGIIQSATKGSPAFRQTRKNGTQIRYSYQLRGAKPNKLPVGHKNHVSD